MNHTYLRKSAAGNLARVWVALAVLLLALCPLSSRAQYSDPPAVIPIGAGGSIAAYPPPAEMANDPRLLDILTREIYLQQGAQFGVADANGEPLKPVPTSDWWTDILMEGDGGTLWQLPMTVKTTSSGLDIKQIGGLTAGSNGGSRDTVSTLHIGGTPLAGGNGTADITLCDFESINTGTSGWTTTMPAGWTITGRFMVTTLAAFPGTAPTNFQGAQFASSKPPNDNNPNTVDDTASLGTLTTAPFLANRSYVHFLMGGGNFPNVHVDLLVNNTVVATVQRNGASGANLSWQKIDLRAYANQNVQLRFVDNQTGSWGYITIDQIVLSNDPIDPSSRVAAGFAAGDARASGWSDWMFTFRKTDTTDATKTMDTTLVRAMPYVWVETNGMDPRLSFDTTSTVHFRDANGNDLTGASFGTRDTISIEVDGKFYGIHVATGSSFEYSSTDRSVTVRLPATDRYLVVSALPRLTDLATFSTYAYAKPLTTRVSYSYDPASAASGVQTQWTYTVQSLRPGATSVLQGWLPPHYRGNTHNLSFLSGVEYDTPRGKLRCAPAAAATGYSINYEFNGIMSHLAKPVTQGLPNDYDAAYLKNLMLSYDASHDGVADDTYYGAKNLVLHARAMLMAKELGMTSTYLNIKSEIEASLTDWFTYQDGETNHFFARNDRWGSLTGFNFVHDFDLGGFTDMHFHYGYFLLAFSYVAMDDPAFRDKFKDMALEIAQAYAEWDRNSTRYPWLRMFEPMVGHSYAGGSSSPTGNNQESSSESIQSWAGLFMLGEALRGNDARSADIMAAAAFGYAIESRAVLEYYQDYHGSPFSSARLDYDSQPAVGTARYPVWPDEFRFGRTVPGYPNKAAWVFTNGIMSDSSNSFGTYFGINPEYIYGIQWLPNAPHMMFLAYDPAFVEGQFETLYAYRDEHWARTWLGTISSAPATLRTEWYKAASANEPDPRVYSIDNPYSDTDMKGLINKLYALNPAFVKDISHEGDPVRDNPLYDQTTGTWLVQFPANDNGDVIFPAAIWQPDVLVSTYPWLVPPASAANLNSYSLTVWSTQAFNAYSGTGAPAIDWNLMASRLSWNPADYPTTPAGHTASITQLVNVMESIGGAWPQIALTFKGFADPDFALEVVAENRRRNNAFASDTDSGMFNYYYYTSLRGLGLLKRDQHLSIPTSLVFDDGSGHRNYMVHNKSPNFELANVFQNGAVIGQVLAKPAQVTVQRGLYAPSSTFSVVGSTPSNGDTGVVVGTNQLVVVFSEAYNPATVNGAVTISGPGGLTLTPQASASPQLAVFKVNGNWTLGGTYTVNIPGTAANADGSKTLGAAAAFSFTIQLPFGLALTGSVPTANAMNAPSALSTVTLLFNSQMNPATLGGVTLTGAGNPVLTYDAAASSSGQAVFDVSRGLQPGGSYTLNVPATVADVYGQTLGTAQTITFTTVQATSVLATWNTTLNVTGLVETGRSTGDTSRALDGGMLYQFDAVGDFVEFTINADSAGIYHFQATGKNYTPRGDFRFLLNGVATGNIWDQTASPQGTVRPFDFGNIALKQGPNVFRFTVSALNGATTPWFSLVDLLFSPVNLAPTVDAGADTAVSMIHPVVSLAGTVSDSDSTPTLAWSVFSGPTGASFGNAAAASTTATFTAAGSYVLKLTANDGANAAVSDTLTVNVTQYPTDYAGFRRDYFGLGNPANSDVNDDFDLDGRTNFFEFAFGTNPKNADASGGLQVTRDAVAGTVIARYYKAVPGLVYQLQRSSALSGWTAVDMSGEVFEPASGMQRVDIPWTPTGGVPIFLRMQVSVPVGP